MCVVSLRTPSTAVVLCVCRVGTVLFLGFPSLLQPPPAAGPGSARTGLGAVQACMEVVQKRMRQHDGSFLQVTSC